MIQEAFVSFNVAQLLKEEGFNEKCRYVYKLNGERVAAPCFMEGESAVDNSDIEAVAKYNGWIISQGDYAFLCPTQQVVIDWLKIEKKIFIDTCALSPRAYIFRVAISDEDECCLEEDYACEEGERYMSSQEAVNAALDYVLSNLLSK